ncbi:MAG: flippase [bacterium]|nr:flippase [bacterium]
MFATVARNSFFIFIARIVDVVSVFILIFLIARYLTAQFGIGTFGQYGFIATLVTFLFSLGYIGISQITIRDVAQTRSRAKRYLTLSLYLRSGLSVILASIILSISVFIRQDSLGLVLAFLMMILAESVSIISVSFLDILIAYELMYYDAIATFIYRLTTLAITVGVIVLNGVLWHIFLAVALAAFAKAVFLGIIYRRTVPQADIATEVPPAPTTGYLIKQSFPLALAFLITQAYMKSGVLLLQALSSEEQVALFYAPLRLLFQFQFIPFALSTALFPIFSRAAKNVRSPENNLFEKQEELSRVFVRAFKFSIILCVPIIVSFLFLARPIILLIFGEKFLPAVSCLQILIISFPVTFLELLMNNFLVSIKQQKLILLCNSLCLVTNLLLNFILIPTYGAIGASWATVGAYIVLFFAVLFFIQKHTGISPLLKTLPKPIIAGIGMIPFLYYAQQHQELISLFILSGISFVVYFVLIILIKGFSAREIEGLKSILKPNNPNPK